MIVGTRVHDGMFKVLARKSKSIRMEAKDENK